MIPTVLALVLGQTTLPMPEKITLPPVVKESVKKEYRPNYPEVRATALANGAAHVIFVGTPMVDGNWYASVLTVDQWRKFGGAEVEPCIIVSAPLKGDMAYYKLEANASTASIMEKLDLLRQHGKVVQAQPSPFARSWPLPSAAHDADLTGRGPWPEQIAFPKGMVRYKRAAYTQEIAVTNGQDRITPVHRSRIDAKYQVSGGMVGISGWRSDVYHDPAARPNVAIANIPVWNGFNFQDNRGWRRAYPDGARFMDVLSFNGTVFAIRKREKVNGHWVPSVEYENLDAAPAGYRPIPLKLCSSCHNDAGTGGYAVGLAPGGDTVMSEPFPALER